MNTLTRLREFRAVVAAAPKLGKGDFFEGGVLSTTPCCALGHGLAAKGFSQKQWYDDSREAIEIVRDELGVGSSLYQQITATNDRASDENRKLRVLAVIDREIARLESEAL